ncbi:MAG: CoA transferase [Pseudomonadales bacterium]|jgi:formyl-CoA transferase|nr:CoA transferase [Pseudomonadales bacterium]MDP7358542.1 CoA transferase [Pseudomonadales bacterium]MDP7595130.1 CoA transferase [Pseudomonadales bacterium]HJN48888.1 CoA transferase [Pseudomonadales bacterium]|tara:strand:+ start:4859 stop:6082 length:1224 start_codon:yes stop_codon:yes gene_type:complete
MASGPLTGIKILEFSQVIAAPYAGQILADMGADVLKVEPPEGESWRLQAQFAPLESKTYQTLNRGKRCITLRLSEPEAQQVVHQLLADMDVVLINYRPDVPARFKIDYETLSAIKADLIYVDLTAFGRKGPWAMRPGYDGAVQAVSGLMAGEGKIRSDDGSPMTISSTAPADVTTGMVLADATTTALYHRQQTGQGQMVQCSLLATALNLQGSVVMEHPEADHAFRNPQRDIRIKRAEEGATYPELIQLREAAFQATTDPFYRAFLTRNGALVVAAESDQQRRWVCDVLDLDESMIGDEPRLEALFVTRTTEEWLEKLVQKRVPCSPVHFPEEMSRHRQVVDNQWMVEMEHDLTGTQRQLEAHLRFSVSSLESPPASPPLGRDTGQVLGSLGFSDDEIRAFAEKGII